MAPHLLPFLIAKLAIKAKTIHSNPQLYRNAIKWATQKATHWSPYYAGKYLIYNSIKHPIPLYRTLLRTNLKFTPIENQLRVRESLRDGFRAVEGGANQLKDIDFVMMNALKDMDHRGGDIPEHIYSDIEVYLMARGLDKNGFNVSGHNK